MNQEDSTPAAEPEAGDRVTDVHDMMVHFFAWHEQLLGFLAHISEIPAGMVMEIDGKSVTLEGDTLAAFVTGIEMATHALKQIPFKVVESHIHDEPEAVQ